MTFGLVQAQKRPLEAALTRLTRAGEFASSLSLPCYLV